MLAVNAERIHVLLPVHNRKSVTARFLDCLARQKYTGFHLVLIDDGCTDGTVALARERFPDAEVLHGTGDWWWAGSLQAGRNWLLSRSLPGADLVLIANDDVRFDEDFLGNAVKVMQGRSRALLLARAHGMTGASADAVAEAGVHVDWSRLTFTSESDPRRVNCFSTRGLFLRVRDLEDIGGFHPFLLPHYGSDYEFTIRAHRKGYGLTTDPAVRLQMNESTTGIRDVTDYSLPKFLAAAFSKRSVLNPFYWTVFVVLACPLRYLPVNVARVWVRFMRQAWAAAKGGRG